MRGGVRLGSRTGTRSAAPSSRRWRRICPIRTTCCTRSCAPMLFAGTPYAHDALGTRPSFDKTTAQMLQQFHDSLVRAQQCHPGDRRRRRSARRRSSEVRSLFGDIPPKKLPARPAVHAAADRSRRRFTVDTDQPNGALMIALRTPGPAAPDFPALEVLADVLSSRRFELYGLVPQGKALEARVLPRPAAAGGARLCGGRPSPPDGDRQALEAEVRAILTQRRARGRAGRAGGGGQAAGTQRRPSLQRNSIEGARLGLVGCGGALRARLAR